MYARRRLSQMHTTKYMPFIRERQLIEKKSEPLGGRPTAPPLFESTAGCALTPVTDLPSEELTLTLGSRLDACC